MISRLNGGGGNLLPSACNAARRLLVGTIHSLARQAPPTNITAARAEGFGARRDFAACRSSAHWERRCVLPTMNRSYSGISGGSGEDAGVFGVVQIGANQYKVSPDDLIFVEKLSDYQVNDKVLFSLPQVCFAPHCANVRKQRQRACVSHHTSTLTTSFACFACIAGCFPQRADASLQVRATNPA